ncbi:MAG: DUF1800 domain-containing protein [Acidimicrobiia bacterium]|nr:DUF1800 domain-containing protein [Acidimicrobiia bacterium]
MKRVQYIVAIGVISSFSLLLPAAANPFHRKLSKDKKIQHALDRLSFGARPGDVEAVKKMGLEKWVERQLHPQRIAENPLLQEKLKPLETLALSSQKLVQDYPLRPPNPENAKQTQSPDLRSLLTPMQVRTLRQGSPAERLALIQSIEDEKREKLLAALPGQLRQMVMLTAPVETRRQMMKARQPVAVIASDLMEAKLYRALLSERQLEEVLVDFWFNHFNVYMNKGADRYLVTSYERDAIRPHVLGKFSDMLLATARHPAMLFYLDNWQSMDPRAIENLQRMRRRRGPGMGPLPPLPRQARGLNENFGRELLELHTLGVDGGYTQQDVVEVARCFTGWTIQNPRQGGGFQFAARLHDRGEKTVLGHKIPAGGGEQDGLKVIEILSTHPSTARYISTRLAQRFVADQPPATLIDRMAATFTKTGGHLRAVMRAMLTSREFFSEGAYRSKMKSPLELVTSAVRAVDAKVEAALVLASRIEQLGQPLYRKEEPTGYPNLSEEWMNTAGLLARMNFATVLASGQLPGVQPDLAALRLDQPGVEKQLAAGLYLGSPEFQRK